MATDTHKSEEPTEERGRSRNRNQSIRRLVEVFNADTNEIVDRRAWESPCGYFCAGTLIEEYSLRGQRFLIKTKITGRSFSLWWTPPPPSKRKNPRWQKPRREARRIKTLLLGSPGMVDEVVAHNKLHNKNNGNNKRRKNNNNSDKRKRRGD